VKIVFEEGDFLRELNVSSQSNRIHFDRSNLQRQVREFHETFELPSGEGVPAVPSSERLNLRMNLLLEELLEVVFAVYSDSRGGITTLDRLNQIRLVFEAIQEFHEVKCDLPALARELADLDYIIEGTRLECGIDGVPVAAVVHATNMAKLGGERRSDGKVLKPEGWQPPDVASELLKQGWVP